jgi:competence protein ComFC
LKPSSVVTGLSIVLIDDVVTTGSTLSACAKELISAGAVSVKAVSLAREM